MITFKNLQLEKFITPNKDVVPDSKIQWKQKLDDSDIEAALEFLNLNVPRKIAEEAIKKFAKHRDRIEWYKAKDILRSAGLTALDKTSTGVEHKLNKISAGKKLTPCLLLKHNDKLIIADGYHRVSALYLLGENERVACVLVHVKD